MASLQNEAIQDLVKETFTDLFKCSGLFQIILI